MIMLPAMSIKHSYISYGKDNIADALIVPCLQCAKTYKRSVGFFSSNALEIILNGLIGLVRNHGHILLVASPNLSQEDVITIKKGYDSRNKIVENIFSNQFEDSIDELDDERLEILYELVSKGILDIKIAVTKHAGMYHDKLGIIEDIDGNAIAFYGSANASYNGYCENYEKVRVSRSWIDGEKDSVDDEEDEFDALWNNTNPFVDVYTYTKCAREHILKVVNNRKLKSKQKEVIRLRDYQEEAIQCWIENNYHGFFEMATGTGKTWTAIYAAKALLEKSDAMLVICAPYKHLIKQWAGDVEKVFPKAEIVLVSSENPIWSQQITQAILKKQYYPNTQIIILTTNSSFYLRRFYNAISRSKERKLLIVDEAHRFTRYSEQLNRVFAYMLALSATPYSGKNKKRGQELINFFGGEVYKLPIEDALKRGYLVPYYYYPMYVHASDQEEMKFNNYSRQIASCYQDNILINKELLVKALRGRLRVISMADEKQQNLTTILKNFQNKNHFVVYCGDGKLFDQKGEELRHIQSVKNVLTDLGFRVSQFTASENMAERMRLVESFNNGDISALVAIRCLDEGINIPSIESALILSSNDDQREFIQRRGRILRKYQGKNSADIYDVVVLPSRDNATWAAIELRRFYEYARLAVNSEELLEKLHNLLEYYSLQLKDIVSFEYEDIEEDEDE